MLFLLLHPGLLATQLHSSHLQSELCSIDNRVPCVYSCTKLKQFDCLIPNNDSSILAVTSTRYPRAQHHSRQHRTCQSSCSSVTALQSVPTSLHSIEGLAPPNWQSVSCPKAAASALQQSALLHQCKPQIHYITAQAFPAMLHAKVLLHHSDAEFHVTLASVCAGV